ncbi:MAG: hypothetical protein L0177_00970 [Chloroflexi bacterium]|nr:hypothetical protein [Chloroflexota bacterium]
MDDPSVYDLDELRRNIRDAEVLSLFFPTFRKALVIDTRSNEKVGPMARVMPMAASPQERLRTLRRLRPGFPRVTNLTLLPWPRYVDSLVRLGVWERLVQRLEMAGLPNAKAECERLLTELRHHERAELAAVVRGDNYHTIWAARQ